MIGGIGRGPRTTRKETQEYNRLLFGGLFLIALGLLFFGVLWGNLILWGPWSVYIIGFASLLLLTRMRARSDKRSTGSVKPFTICASVCVLVTWAIVGLDVGEATLPPWRLRWDLSAKLPFQVAAVIFMVVFVAVGREAYVELTDPEHSMRHTSPQMANRLEPIWPWSHGVQGKEPAVRVVEIPSRALSFSRQLPGGRVELGEIPNLLTREWWNLVRAALHDLDRKNGVRMSEPWAVKFDISPGEFTQTRDALLDAGLLRWRDEQNHNLGAELTFDDGDFWLQYTQELPPPPPRESFIRELENRGLANE